MIGLSLSPPLVGRWGPWACRLILVTLPPLLAIGFYYRPAWQYGAPLPLDGDACFYAYQMERAGASG